jgi:hypothetical protein
LIWKRKMPKSKKEVNMKWMKKKSNKDYTLKIRRVVRETRTQPIKESQ